MNDRSADTDRFNGKWSLLPELSMYQDGEPPASGFYVIGTGDGIVTFDIEWTDASGAEHSLNFSGPLDGRKHAADLPGVSHVCYEKIDESTLESTAYSGEKILLTARRKVSADGELLAVSQVIHKEDGALANYQVYRRQT